MKPRLQNKVAGSELTLPVCAAAAALLWWLPRRGLFLPDILGFAVCLLTTYVIMETNARHHLIRVRSQMTACVWLVLSACLAFMHPLREPLAAAALLALAYMLLFRCYQRHRPEAYVFHAFLMLGAGSFLAPVMLPMGVLFFIYLGTFLRSLTWRSFWAGMLGLAVPYWCFGIWCFFTEDEFIYNCPLSIVRCPLNIDEWGHLCRGFFLDLMEWPCRTWERLSLPLGGVGRELFSAAAVILLALVGSTHFLRTKFDDKIRVRMILYIYVVQTFLLTALLLLHPSGYERTMALLVVSAAPLVAHYFSLSRSPLTTAFLLLALLLVAAMAVLNLWPGAMPFLLDILP